MSAPPVPTQLQPMNPRVRHLRDNLIVLAVELQAQGNRMKAAGGLCMQQADTVHRAGWAAARAAYHVGGNHPDLTLYFAGVGSGKRPDGSPEHDNELELED